MTLTRRLTAAGLVLLASLAPRAAQASSVGWVLCTPGALRACASMHLSTLPVLNAQNVRVGTAVVITVANLQGTNPHDNTAWSRINQFIFSRGASPASPAQAAFIFGVPQGNATLNTFWGYFDGAGGTSSQLSIFPYYVGLGGCSATGPATTFTTCGGQLVFSITTSTILDASEYNAAAFYADANGASGLNCSSDPSLYLSGRSPVTCGDFTNDVTATPEPVTMALLGTGLFGIGGARWRRKKRDAA